MPDREVTMFPTTQNLRPTLFDAYEEATASPDSHWTSNLSRIGMTRIAPTVVKAAAASAMFDALDAVWVEDHGTWALGGDDPTAGFLYESFWK